MDKWCLFLSSDLVRRWSDHASACERTPIHGPAAAAGEGGGWRGRWRRQLGRGRLRWAAAAAAASSLAVAGGAADVGWAGVGE